MHTSICNFRIDTLFSLGCSKVSLDSFDRVAMKAESESFESVTTEVVEDSLEGSITVEVIEDSLEGAITMQELSVNKNAEEDEVR